MCPLQVFVPLHEHEASDNPLLHSAPVRVLKIVATLTIGWFAYLLFNTTGHSSYPKGRWVNHFVPTSPIYSKDCRVSVWAPHATTICC